MGKKKKIIKKRWLNNKNHHSIGLAYVEAEGLKDDYPSIFLTIGDCSRIVTLDFCPTTSKGSIENARHKVKVLREALDDVEKAIDIAEKNRKKK